MNKPSIVFSLFQQDELTEAIQKQGNFELGKITIHSFPDEEVVIQFNHDVKHKVVIFITNLVRPNPKLLPLLFAADTARSMGALKVLLVAPYLAYMRQDKVFESGQGITSEYFAKLLSSYFDGIITVDPHLHRWHSLSAIYSIPNQVIRASDRIAEWIDKQVDNPLLVGPDSESIQWVESIAKKASIPYIVLDKNRFDDTHVSVSTPDIHAYRNATPIVVDDIISSGITMIETIKKLSMLKMLSPICIGVHAVFAENAYEKLMSMDVKEIVTCNTIPHPSNGIDLSHDLLSGILSMLKVLG